LSGPVVATEIAKWIATLPRRRFTYRFVFVPETIGSIVYISRHIDTLKRNMVAGFMVNCVGDERAFGFMPSRRGGTLADRAALHALRHVASEFEQHSFLMRGSDERQYCSPGVDLPVASIFRSKYDTFPEYHTSLDDLDLITPNGLLGALHAFQRAIQAVEADRKYRATVLGEPNLGSRGLYPTVSNKDTFGIVFNLINVFAYSDGDHDLLDIADLLGAPIWELAQAAEDLREHGLLAEADMTGERVP
jgi:aminopeptidase-like protein